MRVLVTGSEGQVVQCLVERAASIPGLTVLTAGRPEFDLERPETIASAIAAAAPDIVVNAAAYTAVDQAEDEPDRAHRINGVGAGEVAAAARAVGAGVIQISTDYVFDGTGQGPYAEDAATGPTGVYGRSKLEGEARVREANPDHAILRTAWVYSPYGRNFVRTMMTLAATRDTLSVVGDQRGNPTSALDLADGILAMVAEWSSVGASGGRLYHLAGMGEASWADLATAIFAECAHAGLPIATVTPIATAEYPTRATRPANSTLDCTRFEANFGFRMPEWRASLPAIVNRIAAAS